MVGVPANDDPATREMLVVSCPVRRGPIVPHASAHTAVWSSLRMCSMIAGLALGSALGTNVAFLFKQRGAVLAPPVRGRHPHPRCPRVRRLSIAGRRHPSSTTPIATQRRTGIVASDMGARHSNGRLKPHSTWLKARFGR